MKHGDAGRALYVVESGGLDVVVTAEEGLRLPVARLGPGNHFGEMSLLTGEPISADVVACEDSVLYAADEARFNELVRPDQELMEHLAGELAARLTRTNQQLSALQQRQAALGKLIGGGQAHRYDAELPSFGKSFREQVEEAAASDEPVVIAGEDGVGRRALAQYIHSQSSRADRPILMADCRELPEEEEEAARCLFGDGRPEFVSRFAERLGYLQAADGGTLVLAHIEALPTDTQEDLASFLATHRGARGEEEVDVRVVATTSEEPEPEEAPDGWSPGLKTAFGAGHALGVRPLRRRRRDIEPLAEWFLEETAQQSGGEPKGLGDDARRELQGYDFAFGNAAELRQVMQLAAHLAPGDTVNAEHLFFGPGGGAEAARLDLLRWPWVEKAMLHGRLLTLPRAAVALFFAGIVVACVVAPGGAVGHWANVLVWGLWWPGLIVSLVFLGRAWCAVCPLSTAAEAFQSWKGRLGEPPEALKRNGPALAIIGFMAIVWVEEVAGMTERPLYTAGLLVSLALAAVVLGWLFERHTWCRYVCPLGAMGAVFSVIAAPRVRARREVCGAACQGQECYKGSEGEQGCPMSSHALFLQGGQHCKLCMACLRSCPSQSPRLILQAPLQEIWRSDLIAADMAPMAAVVGLAALLLAATSGHRGGPWAITFGAIAAIAVGLSLAALLRHRSRTASTRDVSWAARVVYAYAPSAAALLLAFHLGSVPWIADVTLRLGASGSTVVSLSLLELLRWGGAAVGAAMTMWALGALCVMQFGGRRLRATVGWVGLSALAVSGLALGISWLG